MRHRRSAPGPGLVGRRWTAAVSVLLLALSAALLVSVLHGRAPEGTAYGRVKPGPVAGQTRPVYAAQSEPSSNEAGAQGRGETGAQGATGVAVSASEDRGRSQAASRWRAVLAGLDRRRTRAYAAADPALLRRVYAAGSPVLRRDQALLRRYRRHGLQVRDMRMRVLHLRVRARRGDHVALVVRERLARATVLRARRADTTVRGAAVRRALLTDDVDRRVLTLRRGAGAGWRIASVRSAGP